MENLSFTFTQKKNPLRKKIFLEQRVKSNEQKVTSNEQKATCNEQKVTSSEQKVTSTEQRAKSFTSLECKRNGSVTAKTNNSDAIRILRYSSVA